MIIETAQRAHLADMVRIMNGLIAMGDDTAYRTPFTQDRLWDHMALNADVVSRLVAVRDGHVLGFQYTNWTDKPAGRAYIASFMDPRAQGQGIGRALFTQTVLAAKQAGVVTLDATIRTDNVSGLAYYTAMGFVDHQIYRDVTLSDGTRVDQVQKLYQV
jgi:GNAT superfamily N-acetyltransferase